MIKRLLIGTAAGALGAAFAGSAWAQAGVQASGDAAVEQVIVTAQRREQSAQDVGVALSVISGEQLVARGVATVNQLQYATPSLEITPQFGSGQPSFRLRGVGFDDYASNNSSTVGVSVDEVAYPIQAQTQGLLFDIARVEVLRGPQGTLYGRNTTGGAINFITNRPTPSLSAGLTAEYDNNDEFKAEGHVSGPLGDTLSGRLAFVTDQGGAWQKNRATGQKLGDKDTSSVRGQLAWTPNDKADVLLSIHAGYDKSEPTGLYLFNPLGYNASLPTIPADASRKNTGWGGSAAFATLTGIAANAKPFHDTKSSGVSLRAHGETGGVDLVSITAYEKLRRKEYNDWDASQYAYAGTYFDTDAKVFSQELRASSKTEGPLQWLVGGYYSRETIDEAFYSDFYQSLLFDTRTTYSQKVRSASLFGQLEYALSDRLKLVAGLRGEDEKRQQFDFVTAGVFAPGAPPTNFSPTDDKSLKNKAVTGKLALEYKPVDGVLLYASVSKGTKSGGFTSYNRGDAAAVDGFKPETLWAYETGFKSSFAANTVQLNGSVFYYDYKDQQVQSAIYDINNGPIGAIVNAQKSHIYGGELELTWRPVPDLRIGQSLGYKTGKFDKYTNDLDIPASVAAGHAVYISRTGAKVGFPPLSYGGDVSYTWAVGDYEVEAQGNYAFHDKTKPLLLGSRYDVDSYWLANASVTLSPARGPWALTAFARNVFNTRYDLTRNFFLPLIDVAAPGRPATYGVRAQYRF
ncbi:TonB-dependent receptor [Caulobacter sp. 602-1]|uniref:TonB-dependent receptor n=1 Tax=Caulobacter sp. 602-1 TaxID=2492472 RepID=UPI000F63AF70|nr:TonB-dependent receptor [Caulobacter sp. 602-1]RRN64424.1 TonB-dependent receptor [Caulobacter sp. 602-1]